MVRYRVGTARFRLLLQEEFYRRGERTIGLGVDASNPTGATHLYERAGMHVAWNAVIFEKDLAAAGSL